MSDVPGVPAIRHSADQKYLIIRPGVESDDWKFDNPVEDESATRVLALQPGTNRFVTKSAAAFNAIANEGAGA